MYYVRKMSKPSNLQKIKEISDISSVPADFLGQEMRTGENTLSVWRCDSIGGNDMYNAIKAALFASSEIVNMQFIILDSDMLNEAGIRIHDKKGTTGYKGFDELHSDICDLTYEKIGTLLQIYHRTSKIAGRSPKIEKKEFQKFAIEAYENDCLDEKAINERLQKAIQKLVGDVQAS